MSEQEQIDNQWPCDCLKCKNLLFQSRISGLDPVHSNPRGINLGSMDPGGVDGFQAVHELPEIICRMLCICVLGEGYSFIRFSKKCKAPQKLSLGSVVGCAWKSSEIQAGIQKTGYN